MRADTLEQPRGLLKPPSRVLAEMIARSSTKRTEHERSRLHRAGFALIGTAFLLVGCAGYPPPPYPQATVGPWGYQQPEPAPLYNPPDYSPLPPSDLTPPAPPAAEPAPQPEPLPPVAVRPPEPPTPQQLPDDQGDGSSSEQPPPPPQPTVPPSPSPNVEAGGPHPTSPPPPSNDDCGWWRLCNLWD
jgi:hypothetical protein